MEGLLARELVAELADLTRAVRGLVRLVAYALEVEVPANESLEMQREIRERLHAILRESTEERGR
jgi:hypothetical protein